MLSLNADHWIIFEADLELVVLTILGAVAAIPADTAMRADQLCFLLRE